MTANMLHSELIKIGDEVIEIFDNSYLTEP